MAWTQATPLSTALQGEIWSGRPAERVDISGKQDWSQNANVCVDRKCSNKYERLQQLVDCVWSNDNKSNG
jgi:hypothetical protein